MIVLDDKFFKYMQEFEKHLLNTPTFWKTREISTKNCNKNLHKFGQILGRVFLTKKICCIDYYGFLKKSSALLQIKDQKFVLVDFCYFQSIKIQDLSPHLILYFPQFKDTVLKIRGFK
jgi:hypothetical protein